MAKGNTVEGCLQLLRAVAPDLPESTLQEYAQRLHHHYGGGSHYFAKNPSRGKEVRLGEEIAAGVPFAQAWRKAGISLATAYRVRRRWMR